MDFVSISAAFALGFIARRIGLPPLVGFLAAGFVLRAGGATGGPALGQIADLGILLLLSLLGATRQLRQRFLERDAALDLLVGALALASRLLFQGAFHPVPTSRRGCPLGTSTSFSDDGEQF